MNIQGYQKMSVLDFPGKVGCTVFTGGCNLRCPFCHNAGLVRTPLENPNATQEVLTYLEQRRGMLDGVSVTGGEPLLQPDIAAFLQQVRDMGYLVKLDTNGTLPHRLKAVLDAKLVDYVAMDIKSSPDGYSLAVGGETDVDAYRQSVRLLEGSGIPHEFRTTAVKGIHTPEDFTAIGEWLAETKRYFIQRFVDSGNLLEGGYTAFSQPEMEELLQRVLPYIPNAQLRG